MKKITLLEKLLSEGWFANENEARIWAMERKILVNDEPVISVSTKIFPDSAIRVKEYYKKKYVSKGGLKLEGALKDFDIDVSDMVVLDCGASTGGFTDCLIVHGAKKVYAVDVGFGQIAGKLLNCPKVENMERTNLSDPKLLLLSPKPELITLDLSYLSLKKAIPLCQNILGTRGIIIALIKPLFEVESSEIRRSGVLTDADTIQAVIVELLLFFNDLGIDVLKLTYSPIRGNTNTVEYFVELSLHQDGVATNYVSQEHINDVVNESLKLEKFKK